MTKAPSTSGLAFGLPQRGTRRAGRASSGSSVLTRELLTIVGAGPGIGALRPDQVMTCRKKKGTLADNDL